MISILDRAHPDDVGGEPLAPDFLTLSMVEYKTLLAALSRSVERAAKLL
jgi:hypothetical protein